jgi:hypothetical protein
MGRIKHIMQLYREGWSEEEIQKEITSMLSNSDPRDIIKQIKEIRESADADKGSKS